MTELERLVDAAENCIRYLKDFDCKGCKYQHHCLLWQDPKDLAPFVLTHIRPLVEGVKPIMREEQCTTTHSHCGKCDEWVGCSDNYCHSCGNRILWEDGDKDIEGYFDENDGL
jgi:hypothetical protein